MTAQQIGFELTEGSLAIKQGSSGAVNFTATVTKEDGSALDTYDGAVALMKFYRNPQDAAPEFTFTPTVVGVPANKQFKITLTVAPADTASHAVGELVGDLKLTDASGGVYFCADLTLTIERSYS